MLKISKVGKNLLVASALSLALSAAVQGQDGFLSEVLTDRIHKGDGVIDILKDVSGSELANYFDETDGRLLLGVDLNEAAAPPESSNSIGVAIRQVQLSISTTDGDFTFSDFFTDTTAMLRDGGSETAQEFHTLFGRVGSSAITGNEEIQISTVEDLLWIDNVSITGEIISASLHVELVDVPGRGETETESFFDFSNGFEEFGIVSTADAMVIDAAQLGLADAPASVEYETGVTAPISGVTAPISEVMAPPGAPVPPLVACLGLAALFFVRTSLASQRSK